jgi:dimethylargininase
LDARRKGPQASIIDQYQEVSTMLYTHALARTPGRNFSDGITSANLGKPDYGEALRQHALYVEALKHRGIAVFLLEPDLEFPDGCFVEDTAVVTPQMAVVTNPGAPTRRGETASITEVIRKFRKLFFIQAPGTLEGGDVMRAEGDFYVGLSGRTNREGTGQFAEIAGRYGYRVSAIQLDTLLHLKSGIAYIGNNTVVCTRELSRREEFRNFSIIELAPEENYAANCLRLSTKTLVIPSGCPRFKKTLFRRGYEVIDLEMTEFQKMDGGLTCLSLLFSAGTVGK